MCESALRIRPPLPSCGLPDSSMIGQGSHVKSWSPPVASSESCGEVLGTPFTTSPCPPPPTPGDLRRLAKAPHPTLLLKCPRCDSLDTKFCYYNNYSLSQPRYFCKNCKRYWTAGGALRNVPVGGGLRKNKRCKLKLQAEAEAAAAAAHNMVARETSAQLPQYEGKPLSGVLASSGSKGSSSTSTSSIVSGIPANFVATAALPNFHSTNATHLIRTSSGSDGSTLTYAGNDNCGSVATGVQQQNGNRLQHFLNEVCGQAAVPQFYSRYSTSLPPSSLQQYGGTLNERGASCHAAGYVSQLMQSSSNSVNLLSGDTGAGSNPAHASNYSNGAAATYEHEKGAGSNPASSYSNGVRPYHAVINNNGSDMEEEKEDIINTNPHYDWQLISDTLFNGAASEGFEPLPGGSWPDFSQFQDPSGPG